MQFKTILVKNVLLAIFAFGLYGCKDLKGILNVQSAFPLKTTSGVVNVTPGSYDTQLDFKKNKIEITVKTGNKKAKLEVKTQGKIEVPQNGEFVISPEQSGQEFTVNGKNSTEVTRSNRQSTWKSCTYQTPETYCTPQGCYQQIVTRWGQQYIEYYNETTKRDTLLAIVHQGQNAANFESHSVYQEQVIVRETMCR